MAKAKGDGYTLIAGQSDEMAVNRSAMKRPGHDSLADFRPVALVGDAPLLVLAEPDLRARFEADGSAVEPMPPARFAAFVRAEVEKYARLVRTTGAQIE